MAIRIRTYLDVDQATREKAAEQRLAGLRFALSSRSVSEEQREKIQAEVDLVQAFANGSLVVPVIREPTHHEVSVVEALSVVVET